MNSEEQPALEQLDALDASDIDVLQAQSLSPDGLLPSTQADSENSSESNSESDVNLDMILDVPVTMSLEIGRTKMPIRTLLQLNQGSVIELERGAGEPLDVYVNGTLIAHGEVVVINDRFGMRLTDVVSPSERIRRLR